MDDPWGFIAADEQRLALLWCNSVKFGDTQATPPHRMSTTVAPVGCTEASGGDVEGGEECIVDVEALKAKLFSESVTAEELEAFIPVAKSSTPSLDRDAFLRMVVDEGVPCIDVRSPAEYTKGRIPCSHSHNMPLFSNEERAVVGTAYNKQGRTKALMKGMALVRPKLRELVHKARDVCEKHGCKRVAVHCWRGGMRSASVAWLLKHEAGLEPVLLSGGYKSFREWAVTLWDEDSPFAHPRICILGGRTGCGKTKILHELKHRQNKQVLDLEGLANHAGSSFGWVAQEPQPTSEHYGNLCAMVWRSFTPDDWVYIEDEAPNVGRCSVPPNLYVMMRAAPLILKVVLPFEARINILVEDYGGETARATDQYKDRMIQAIHKMKKKLGPDRTAHAVATMEKDEYGTVAEILLTHYDALYDKHVANSTGTGTGSGTREGLIVPVEAPADATRLDCDSMAREVLRLSKAFDSGAIKADGPRSA